MSWPARLLGWLTRRPARARGRAGTRRAVAIEAAPERWRRYAQQVSACVSRALEEAEVAAQRSRDAIDAYAVERAATGDPAPALRLGAWLDARGRITRVEAERGQAASGALGAALGEMLIGRPVGAAPPLGMPQPVRVRLTFADHAR